MTEPTEGRSRSPRPLPLEVLSAARLTSEVRTMEDGYSSLIMRSNVEAAKEALDALAAAGYVVVRHETLAKIVTVVLRNETFGSEDEALAEAVAALDVSAPARGSS